MCHKCKFETFKRVGITNFKLVIKNLRVPLSRVMVLTQIQIYVKTVH